MANVSIWDPFYAVRSDFERLLSDFFPSSVKRMWGSEALTMEPAVDVLEKENAIMVRAELPGIARDEIKLEIHENKLIIKGEHKTEKEDKKDNFYRKEIEIGSFYRMVDLPSDVDASTSEATLKDGILEVNLKKIEPSKPIEIAVK